MFFRDVINVPLPNSVQITQPFVHIVDWFTFILLFTLVLKFFFKAPNMKKAIVSTLSILIVYVVYLLIYAYGPQRLQNYLAPLPFIEYENGELSLILYHTGPDGLIDFPKFCNQVVSMLLFAFLVSQIYSYKNANLKSLGWLVFRLFSTFFCIGVHYAVSRVLARVLALVPEDSIWEILVEFIPTIGLLTLLLVTYILGLVRNLMRKFFKLVNPTFEGLNGFYFVNKFGVIVTRALYSTALLTWFAYGLQFHWSEACGTSTVAIDALARPATYFTLIVLFLLWLMIGQAF